MHVIIFFGGGGWLIEGGGRNAASPQLKTASINGKHITLINRYIQKCSKLDTR